MFFLWLALATRHHKNWFCPFIVQYGGDTLWAAMFLFFLRIFFAKTNIVKLAIINFLLGAADETLQLYQAPWIQTIRQNKIGGLLLGYGFLWSDIVCYLVGTLISLCIICMFEKKYTANNLSFVFL